MKTPWDKDLEEKREAIYSAQTEDELFNVLGISGSSPEAYYTSLVWKVLTERIDEFEQHSGRLLK